MKRTFNLSATLKVLVLMFGLSLTACDNPIFDPIDPWKGGGGNGGGGKNPDTITDCRVTGKMVRVPCGVSIYDGLWIQTSDGKLYQPCAQSFQTLCPILLEEGDVVKFSYRNLKGGSVCDSMITCMIALPPHQSVVIDCINRTATSTPSLLIDSSAQHDNSINVLNATVVGNTLKIKIGYSGCNVKSADKFKLYWDGSLAKSNPAKAYLALVDLEPQACMAYFTQELEYDISLLKMYGSPIELNLQNITVLYQ